MPPSSDPATIVANIFVETTTSAMQRIQAIMDAYIGEWSEPNCSTYGDDDRDNNEPCQPKAWFMANLADPYPPMAVRRRFAADLGVSLRKIDAQFTNWRRRTGWSRIKKTWANDSHKDMTALMTRYARGQESRPDVCAAIRRMATYLEEDTAGQWVSQILQNDRTPHPSRSSSLSLVSSQLSPAASSFLSTPRRASSSSSPSAPSPSSFAGRSRSSSSSTSSSSASSSPSSTSALATDTTELATSRDTTSQGMAGNGQLMDVTAVKTTGPARMSRKRRRCSSLGDEDSSRRTRPKSESNDEKAVSSDVHFSASSPPALASTSPALASTSPGRQPLSFTRSHGHHHTQVSVELQTLSRSGMEGVAASDEPPALFDWLDLFTPASESVLGAEWKPLL